LSETTKEIVSSKRNIASTMSGIGVALLTFTINFFYPRLTNDEISQFFVSIILATIILSIFCFAVSVLYYQSSLELYVLRGENQQTTRDNKQGDLFFLVALFSLLLEPGLILWAIKLLIVSLLSLIFLVFLISFVVLRRRR
jgi:hypothetical protein